MLKYALHYLEEGLLDWVCCVTDETTVCRKNALMWKAVRWEQADGRNRAEGGSSERCRLEGTPWCDMVRTKALLNPWEKELKVGGMMTLTASGIICPVRLQTCISDLQWWVVYEISYVCSLECLSRGREPQIPKLRGRRKAHSDAWRQRRNRLFKAGSLEWTLPQGLQGKRVGPTEDAFLDVQNFWLDPWNFWSRICSSWKCYSSHNTGALLVDVRIKIFNTKTPLESVGAHQPQILPSSCSNVWLWWSNFLVNTSGRIWDLRASPALIGYLLPRRDLAWVPLISFSFILWKVWPGLRGPGPSLVHCYYFVVVSHELCCLRAMPWEPGEEIQNLMPRQEDARKETGRDSKSNTEIKPDVHGKDFLFPRNVLISKIQSLSFEMTNKTDQS